LAGTPQIQILPDDFLEEDAAVDGLVEHLRQRELRLESREFIATVPSGCRLTLFRREEECDGAGGAVQ
jgi:hypothetical protein